MLKEGFRSEALVVARALDRITRSRLARIQARRTAGGRAGGGTFPGSTKKFGQLSRAAMEDFYLT
jgi:hypothetical protein